MYVFRLEVLPAVAIVRAFLAVPGHNAFAVITGYYYSVYHFVNYSDNNKVKIFLIPFLSHGIYDSLVMSISVNTFIWVLHSSCLITSASRCTRLQKPGFSH